MGVSVKECVTDVIVEERVETEANDRGAPRTSATEADKIRRQQQLRRKTKLVRLALAANRK